MRSFLQRRPRVRSLIAFCLLWSAHGGVRAGDAPPPNVAEWIASDAVVYLEVSAPERVLDYIYSPEVKTLIEAAPGLKKQLNERTPRELQQALEYVGRAVGMSATRLVRELTAGGVTAAFEAPDRVLIVIRARDGEVLKKAHAALLDLARQDAKQKGKPDPVRSREHKGVTLYQAGEQAAYAILDNALIGSSKAELVERTIDRAKGEGGAFESLAQHATWQARKEALPKDAAAWAFARLDRIRALDPNFMKGKPQDEPGAKFLLGAWFETLQKAEWASLVLNADRERVALALDMPLPESATTGALAAYRPSKGQGAVAVVRPEGALLSVSLWRDFSAIWDVRDKFLPPEALQGFAQLDSFAGQFFGGRDFGTGVLGSLDPDWRVVVMQQDYEKMKPAPDLKFPGVAVLLDLKPEDEEFPVRLQAAFQSFVGLVNLGSAQQKAPPLMLGSEVFEGVTIATSSYVAPKNLEPGKPVDPRFNLTPCAAQVGDTFIIASSIDAARAVIKELKRESATAAKIEDYTLIAEASGAEAARLVEVNKQNLVMQNMLQRGNNKQAAESEIELLSRALRFLGNARLTINDAGSELQARLTLDLGR